MRLALASCEDLPDWEVDDRPLHEALRASGHDVHTPPWNADLDWSGFEGVLLRTPWDYTRHLPEFLSWCDGLAGRLWNPPAVVRWNTHKGYLRELEAQGVPVVPTVWLDEGGPLPGDPTWQGELFLKPCVGASAEGTARFDHWGAGARAHAAELVAQGDAMLQPFLSSVLTEGERSAIAIDGQVTHMVRKIPVPGDYRVQDDYGASDEAYVPTEEEKELVDRVLATLPPDLLYARIDWLLDEQGRPGVNEVELVEPSLFFRHGPHAAEALAEAWLRRLS